MISQRPRITTEIINQIATLIKEKPEWNRTTISKHLCRIWGWENPKGQFKDISCRDMLRELEKRGQIILPPQQRISRVVGSKPKIEHLLHDTTPISCKLRDIQPLKVNQVSEAAMLGKFKSLIDQYHYLGYDRLIGENMKYIIRTNSGDIAACLLFGSAAWTCKDRDTYIGWDKKQRSTNLQYLTNNTRYLILPWVRVPDMASHILGLVTKRISKDWELRYGHALSCLETFVERDRFRGTCYKAANWQCVGQTTGKGRNSTSSSPNLPIKQVFLYPLTSNFRRQLTR